MILVTFMVIFVIQTIIIIIHAMTHVIIHSIIHANFLLIRYPSLFLMAIHAKFIYPLILLFYLVTTSIINFPLLIIIHFHYLNFILLLIIIP